MDSLTVPAAAGVPSTTGLDAGKKSRGRKRGIANDALGLLIAVVVTAASVDDNAIGIQLLGRVAIDTPSVRTAWVDAGFKNAVAAHGAELGIALTVVQPELGTKGFTPVPKRWVAEQTFGTNMLHCHLASDCEKLPGSSESRPYWAGTDRMTRRPTGATTRWRVTPAGDPVAVAAA